MNENKVIEEAVTKEDIKKSATVAGKGIAKGSSKVLDIIPNAVTKVALKAPGIGADESIYEKYKQDMIKWKASIKVVEILAIGAVTIGPIDFVLKACILTGMKETNSEVDQKVLNTINQIKEKSSKIKELMTKINEKLKNKQIKTEAEFMREINVLDAGTSKLAKDADYLRTLTKKKGPAIKKATFNTSESAELLNVINENVQKLLYDEDGSINEYSYEAVMRSINNLNEEDERDNMIVEAFVDELLNYYLKN